MKNNLITALCIVLALALACGAVCLGAYRGWSGERSQVLEALSREGKLALSLQNRAMDAANLAVVASRHVKEGDAASGDVAALREGYAVLTGENADAAAIARADAAISGAASRLAAVLPELPSVQASPRDQAYISTLTRTLSEDTGAAAAFAGAVRDYNARLTGSLTGRLAMLLGVAPLTAE